MSDEKNETVEVQAEQGSPVETSGVEASAPTVEVAAAAAAPTSEDLGDGATEWRGPGVMEETEPTDLDRAIAAVGDLNLQQASEQFIGGRILPFDVEDDVTLDRQSGYPWRDVSTPEELGEITDDETAETAAAGDEDESVDVDTVSSLEEGSEDIVYEVAVAAASTGRDFDGRMLAEYLEDGGPITDVRLALALGVLRLGTKLTGDRMLSVLEQLGFKEEAATARIAKDELAKIGDVPVEVTTALPAPMEGS